MKKPTSNILNVGELDENGKSFTKLEKMVKAMVEFS